MERVSESDCFISFHKANALKQSFLFLVLDYIVKIFPYEIYPSLALTIHKIYTYLKRLFKIRSSVKLFFRKKFRAAGSALTTKASYGPTWDGLFSFCKVINFHLLDIIKKYRTIEYFFFFTCFILLNNFLIVVFLFFF